MIKVAKIEGNLVEFDMLCETAIISPNFTLIGSGTPISINGIVQCHQRHYYLYKRIQNKPVKHIEITHNDYVVLTGELVNILVDSTNLIVELISDKTHIQKVWVLSNNNLKYNITSV